jgi:hypothetical protein
MSELASEEDEKLAQVALIGLESGLGIAPLQAKMGQPPVGCGAEILRERQHPVVKGVLERTVAHGVKCHVTVVNEG